jgi:hypothetical protein
MSVEPGRQGAGGKVRILSACHIGEWSTSVGKQPARGAVLKRYCVRQEAHVGRTGASGSEHETGPTLVIMFAFAVAIGGKADVEVRARYFHLRPRAAHINKQ